jgi:hypothetical protein
MLPFFGYAAGTNMTLQPNHLGTRDGHSSSDDYYKLTLQYCTTKEFD